MPRVPTAPPAAPPSRPGGHVLVVDDDDAMRDFLTLGLSTSGFTVETRRSSREALEYLATSDVDVVVTDWHMPGDDGLELCRRAGERYPDVPVLVLTAFGTYEGAVDAIRVGAYDFLSKPINLDALATALKRAVERRVLRREVKRLRQSLDDVRGFSEVVGESPAMQKVFSLLERIVASDSSVLITGESGSGKEVVARALHRRGLHPQGPFVAINCAAMPEALLEAELFGHEKGAFTDAKASRAGLFVEANGGTLFLDEIGDMPAGLQAKILRALQERTVRPVGGRTEIPFDARIVSATNRDLQTLIEEGKFREDLFFRINVIQVELPSLKARGGDVLLLAQRFVESIAKRTGKNVIGIDADAAAKLLAYSWPGNVRELQNCIERAIALARHDHVTVDDLPDRIAQFRPAHVLVTSDDPADLVTLEEVERRYILRVLEATAGNRAAAAKLLGLDRTTLWRRLERYGAAGAKTSLRKGHRPAQGTHRDANQSALVFSCLPRPLGASHRLGDLDPARGDISLVPHRGSVALACELRFGGLEGDTRGLQLDGRELGGEAHGGTSVFDACTHELLGGLRDGGAAARRGRHPREGHRCDHRYRSGEARHHDHVFLPGKQYVVPCVAWTAPLEKRISPIVPATGDVQ